MEPYKNLHPHELRERWRRYCRAQDKAIKATLANGTLPNLPPMPAEFRELRCGARTRAGTPCKQRVIYSNGRCKFHGGLSTGPKSPEGKARSAANGYRRRQTPWEPDKS